MKSIECPCCENHSSYDEWYELGSDNWYPCPVCKNVCTPDEIEPQFKEESR